MTERAKKYLFDILFSIEAIEEFLKGYDFLKYQTDLKTKSAVERQLGIIGEAVNKFSKEELNHQLINSREIVNFRNRIIHAYDSVDDSIVWAIQTNHLPVLKNEVKQLLNIK
ncbi:MAG: hypothetical protein DSY76_05380 [Bacteroidetes bacterium]|nr:MAG: hypothetical protein DSY76_05380 [Bacteroidota bacterium]